MKVKLFVSVICVALLLFPNLCAMDIHKKKTQLKNLYENLVIKNQNIEDIKTSRLLKYVDDIYALRKVQKYPKLYVDLEFMLINEFIRRKGLERRMLTSEDPTIRGTELERTVKKLNRLTKRLIKNSKFLESVGPKKLNKYLTDIQTIQSITQKLRAYSVLKITIERELENR